MLLSLFCHIKQFCFPFPLLGVADFTLVGESSFFCCSLVMEHCAFCGVTAFMHNYHLCNFWFCLFARYNNKNLCEVLFSVTVGPGQVCTSLCEKQLRRQSNFHSDAKPSKLPDLIQYLWEIFAPVLLAPERNMAEQFGCIPKLLCGSALHLTLY